MHATISSLGALSALVITIVLVLRKVPPAYGMLVGALAGGLIGGADLTKTIALMIAGSQGVVPSALRIMAAGVLAGVLIESGAAARIADSIVKVLGETKALIALAVACLVLTAVGVFIDVSVITVAPIALVIAERAGISKMAILLAMSGGGKAGNLMSPNPNAIAVSDAFHVPLTSVMSAGIIPGLVGLVITFVLAKTLIKKGSAVPADEVASHAHGAMPGFAASICGPVIAILLIALRPLCNIQIDPLVALPLGGLIGLIAMGKFSEVTSYSKSGLARMAPVAIMLLGTGTLAGIMANSGLKTVLTGTIDSFGLPPYLLATMGGVFMAIATASTTAGSVVASQVFGPTLMHMGLNPLAAAAMLHSGAVVADHMPHGPYFNVTAGTVNMSMRERLKTLPYECLIGGSMALVSTLLYGVFKIAN
jgi:GntP family gluconate:H+ symporter